MRRPSIWWPCAPAWWKGYGCQRRRARWHSRFSSAPRERRRRAANDLGVCHTVTRVSRLWPTQWALGRHEDQEEARFAASGHPDHDPCVNRSSGGSSNARVLPDPSKGSDASEREWAGSRHRVDFEAQGKGRRLAPTREEGPLPVADPVADGRGGRGSDRRRGGGVGGHWRLGHRGGVFCGLGRAPRAGVTTQARCDAVEVRLIADEKPQRSPALRISAIEQREAATDPQRAVGRGGQRLILSPAHEREHRGPDFCATVQVLLRDPARPISYAASRRSLR